MAQQKISIFKNYYFLYLNRDGKWLQIGDK